MLTARREPWTAEVPTELRRRPITPSGDATKRLVQLSPIFYVVAPMSVADVENELRSLLGIGFAVAAAPPRLHDPPFEEERRHVACSSADRRAEFCTVRDCARRALSELGAPPGPLAPAPDGSPRWPAGVVGSLSHTREICAAAVASAAATVSLGIDLEPDAPLENDLETLICTGAERAWIGGRPAHLRGRLGKLIFSAKEAFYKCQHPLTGAFLDFADVDLVVDMDSRSFRVARAARGAARVRLAAVRGRYGYAGGHLITAAVVAADAVPRG